MSDDCRAPPQGFCLPQELMAGGDGEGATEFHDYEGGGIGEGEGTKDVSDKIENEDQVTTSLECAERFFCNVSFIFWSFNRTSWPERRVSSSCLRP